jgi:divinyl chlorophyllide a 8-vinyl-reductase
LKIKFEDMSHLKILSLIVILLCIQTSSLILNMSNRIKVAIFGSTGYIGKFVVKESVRRGYDTIAVVR